MAIFRFALLLLIGCAPVTVHKIEVFGIYDAQTLATIDRTVEGLDASVSAEKLVGPGVVIEFVEGAMLRLHVVTAPFYSHGKIADGERNGRELYVNRQKLCTTLAHELTHYLIEAATLPLPGTTVEEVEDEATLELIRWWRASLAACR